MDELNITEQPTLRVQDCKMNNGWDVGLLRCLVGENKLEEILESLGEHKEGVDLLIWKPNDIGVFSTKSAWECTRVRGPIASWSD